MWKRILYVYMYTGYIMVNLYWRVKKPDGKWTWKPVQGHDRYEAITHLWNKIALESEEE